MFSNPFHPNIEITISNLSLQIVFIASIILILLTTLSLYLKKTSSFTKKVLFTSITLTALVTTLFLAGSTIYLNQISTSKGPVHYHADIEFWVCDKQLDIKNPQGFSNKIGTNNLHEHNDKRIHLEGVIVNPEDASLGKFMEVIGGSIDENSISIPTDSELITQISGFNCPGQPLSVLQVFVYKVENNRYFQTKLVNPQDYIFSPNSQVPPGDCIIVEFTTPKEKTDKICLSYKVAQQLGKTSKQE